MKKGNVQHEASKAYDNGITRYTESNLAKLLKQSNHCQRSVLHIKGTITSGALKRVILKTCYI